MAASGDGINLWRWQEETMGLELVSKLISVLRSVIRSHYDLLESELEEECGRFEFVPGEEPTGPIAVFRLELG